MKRIFSSIIVLSLLGCSDSDNSETIDEKAGLVSDVRTLIEPYQLQGLSQHVANLPNIEQPIAQLGMQLFYAKSLSGNIDTACVSCHHPFLGGGDDFTTVIKSAASEGFLGKLISLGAILNLIAFFIFQIGYNKFAATIIFLILIYALFLEPLEISNGRRIKS